jgi:GNAT superfamily N-acetyltransferase
MTDETPKPPKPPERVRLGGLQEAQLAALVELEKQCTAMYHEIGFDAAEVPARTWSDLARLPRDHDVYVAEADHEVAGYVAWRDESPGVAFVDELSVLPRFQRFGVGTTLLNRVRERAREIGLPVIVLRAWAEASWARAFYEKQGFKVLDDSAHPRVLAWREEHGAVHPVAREGELVLWAPA